MAVCGPRPLLVKYLPLYNEHQARRHEVRPGFTGLAQVNGRNSISWEEKFDLDALCEAVKKLGFESEIIWEQGNVSKNYDFRPHKIFMTALKLLTHPFLTIGVLKSMKEVKSKPVSEEKAQKFDAFVDDCITQRLFSKKELSQIAKGNEFAKFICGSDQVWCSTTMYVDPLMYLRFAPKAKRIAYAPSIGRDYIPTYNQRQMKKYISEIPYVSIREEEGKKIIKDLTGRDVPVVLDPTLLLTREDWVKLAKSEIQSNDKYAILYFLDEPEELNQKQIMKFLRNNHLSAFSIGQNFSNVEKAENIKCPSCGPKDFLSLIRDAEIVITDSYHGMQVYNRPSCFECKFRGAQGVGDIRVGDFWGIKKTDAYWNSAGVSCIFVRTELGENAMNMFNESELFLYKTDYKTATLSNMSSYSNKSDKYVRLRKKFAEVFKKRGLVAACIATGTASFWAKHIVPDQFHVAIKRVYHFFKDKR